MNKKFIHYYAQYRNNVIFSAITTSLIALILAIILDLDSSDSIHEEIVYPSRYGIVLTHIGILCLLIAQLILAIRNSDKSKHLIKTATICYITITAIISALYGFGIISKVSWLMGVEQIVFSSVVTELINQSVVKRHNYLLNNRLFKTLYTLIMLLLVLILSFTIVSLFKEREVVLAIDIIPIIALAITLVNILVGYNIIYSNQREKLNIQQFAILSLLTTPFVWWYNIEICFVMMLLYITILIFIERDSRVSNLTIFYSILLVISLICAYKMCSTNTIYLYNELLLLTNNGDEPIGLYSAITHHTEAVDKVVSQPIKFRHLLAIFCYISLTSIGLGMLLLRRRLFNINFNGLSARDREWKIICITIYGVIVATILISKNFSQEINHETQRLCITEISKSVKNDYTHKRSTLSEWLNDKSRIHGVDIDVYSRNGVLKGVSNQINEAKKIRPHTLSSEILNNVDSKNVLIKDELYDQYREYMVAYSILDSNTIVRIPLNPNFTITKLTPIITKAINISVISILLLVLFLTLSYHNQTKPLTFLKNNRKKIDSHQKIVIPHSLRSNHELNYLLNEYNKMASQLSHWHSLQMVVERQILYDRTMRMVAHEIKNPLTPMLLMSQLSLRLLEEGSPKSRETVEKTLHTIIEQTKRITALITNMMNNQDNVRISSEHGNVVDVVSNVIQFYSLNTTIAFKMQGVDSDDKVYTNITERDLWSIISNIVINGIDAITGSSQTDGEIYLSLESRCDVIVVKIRNNGPQIDPDYVARLFEYNFTTKPSGNGLGLFVSLQIVKYAGGSIKLNYSNQKYTEFEVVLPRSEKI